MSDPRVGHLKDIIFNLEECAPDQSDHFLAEVSYLAQKLRGLVEVERLMRALQISRGDDDA